ncbi:hypothetical protein EVAR_22760_1 [Eumeta japonica]|uniref:Uncharacterized protein n=1 Tax=Eumeta variegata TaxID=151549 RepID=A0A4C1USG7_EUMVA|nr:hypothetical protein EVAR_22760_1 [Eumeta japonica]
MRPSRSPAGGGRTSSIIDVLASVSAALLRRTRKRYRSFFLYRHRRPRRFGRISRTVPSPVRRFIARFGRYRSAFETSTAALETVGYGQEKCTVPRYVRLTVNAWEPIGSPLAGPTSLC